MSVSAALSFTFGSYGDFASVLSTAFALRRALVAIVGSSKELSIFINDIDTFTQGLQAARVAFDEANDAPQSVRNALGDALNKCQIALDDAKKRADAYNNQLFRQATGKRDILKKPYATLAWEIFGGKAEAEKIWRRVRDQLVVINTLLLASLPRDTFQKLEARASNVDNNIEEIKRSVEETQRRMYELPKLMGYGVPFYFFGNDGKPTLPAANLSVEELLLTLETFQRYSDDVPTDVDMAMKEPHLQLVTFSPDIFSMAGRVMISFHCFFQPSSPYLPPTIVVSSMSCALPNTDIRTGVTVQGDWTPVLREYEHYFVSVLCIDMLYDAISSLLD